MSIAEITAFVERINYAAFFFRIGDSIQKFGPGCKAWERALATLTDEAHEAMSQRLGQSATYRALMTVGVDEQVSAAQLVEHE